jgi:aspartate kinase
VTDISFTVPHDDLDEATRITGELASAIGATGVTTDPDIAKVSIVGAGMKSNPGVAAKMFETLADAGVNIEMISTSAIRISCVVAEPDIERAAQVLHAAFELDIPA